MAGEKPTAAMVLSIIGGLLILLAGVVFLAVAEFLEALLLISLETLDVDPVATVQIIGIIGVLLGIIIIVGGVMMYSRPASSTVWGVIILVLSLVSIIAMGGFFIGLVLGLVGGILGIVFKPAPAIPTSDTSQMQPPPPSQ